MAAKPIYTRPFRRRSSTEYEDPKTSDIVLMATGEIADLFEVVTAEELTQYVALKDALDNAARNLGSGHITEKDRDIACAVQNLSEFLSIHPALHKLIRLDRLVVRHGGKSELKEILDCLDSFRTLIRYLVSEVSKPG